MKNCSELLSRAQEHSADVLAVPETGTTLHELSPENPIPLNKEYTI